MKGRESLRKLRHLWSITRAARTGGGYRDNSTVPVLRPQLCLVSCSSADDVPYLRRDHSRRRLNNQPSCTANSVLPRFPLSYDSCTAPSLLHSHPRTLSFYTPFSVSSATLSTVREKVQEEEEEEVQVGGNEKAEVEGHWRQVQRETQPGVEECPGERLRETHVPNGGQLIRDTESLLEVERYSNGNSVRDGHGDDSGKVEVEAWKEVGWSELGWTSEEVLNLPNAISMARLLSGPLLAWMIVHELWTPALIGLVIAGISDWLDGYIARKMDINSVLGSYLDPVADKFLVGSLAVSMAYTGLLHRKGLFLLIILWRVLMCAVAAALVGLIVARDGVLMGGAFVYRAYSLGWQLNDWREFFRISVGGAGKVEPLFISKVNTVFQLALVGVALLQPALSMEDTYSLVPLLSWSVVATTSMSWFAYAYLYLKNPENLAALKRVARAPGHKASP